MLSPAQGPTLVTKFRVEFRSKKNNTVNNLGWERLSPRQWSCVCLRAFGQLWKKSSKNNLVADETGKYQSKLHHFGYFLNKLQQSQISLLPKWTFTKNWDSLYPKLNSHSGGWSYKKKNKKPKTRREILWDLSL